MLVTSKAEREMKIEGLELGADDYLTKPFHPRELMARVRSLVRVRRLERELAGRNQTLSKALADLEQTQVQLVQAERLAAVGALAAGVAHEINNPVNFAINAARTLHTTVEELIQLVQAGTSTTLGDPEGQGGQGRAGAESVGELGAMASELAGIVSEGLDRTRRIVADLRDFAAPSRGPQQRVDLGNSLRATADLLRHDLMKAGAQLELAVAPDLPEVRGDPGALNQVCLNLIKNAAEALAGRVGSIPGSIRLEASAEGGAVRIRVRDNGPGMPPEVQERLFEPFFTTKEVGQGTGLGLSISKQIIEAHDGSLTVESVLGEGTTFTIELPRDRGEEGD
jgi:signal transduction histidine kinase